MPKAKAKPIVKREYKTSAERKAHLKTLMKDINSKYGDTVLRYGNTEEPWTKLSFTVPQVDEFTGGGTPYGHFSVIYGGVGSGKTTLALYQIAQAQREGKTVYLIDLENSYDEERAKIFGVDTDSLIVGHFEKAEESLDSILKLTRERVIDLIVLDSIHSLSPKNEQVNKKGEKSTADDSMALLARKLSQWFRMAVDPVARAKTDVLLIGQVRSSVGLFAIEMLTGGNALKHYSVMTIKVSRGKKDNAPKEYIPTGELDDKGKPKKKQVIVGFECVLKMEKTKTPGSKPEGSVLRIPYKFKDGFNELIELDKEAGEALKEMNKSEKPKPEKTINEIDGEVKPKKKRGRPRKK